MPEIRRTGTCRDWCCQIAGGPHQPRINGDAISFVRVILGLLHRCTVVDVLVASVAVANLLGRRWLQLLPLLRALEVKPKLHGVVHVRARRSVPAAQSDSAFREGQFLDVQIASEDLSQVAILGFDAVAS